MWWFSLCKGGPIRLQGSKHYTKGKDWSKIQRTENIESLKVRICSVPNNRRISGAYSVNKASWIFVPFIFWFALKNSFSLFYIAGCWTFKIRKSQGDFWPLSEPEVFLRIKFTSTTPECWVTGSWAINESRLSIFVQLNLVAMTSASNIRLIAMCLSNIIVSFECALCWWRRNKRTIPSV